MSSIVKFISLAAATVLGLLLLSLPFSTHVVKEGNVGVVYRLGSLQEKILHPGLHFAMPLITEVHQVQVTTQTDHVTNVICGTNSGVNAVFDKIEVVNQLMSTHVYEIVKNYTVDYDKQLIFDKICYEMAQFCSKVSMQEVYIEKFDQLDEFLFSALQKSLDEKTPGLKIISVRLSKPIIPLEMQENYKKITLYKTEILKGETEKEKNIREIEANNMKALSQLNADKNLTVYRIQTEQSKKMQEIEATKLLALSATEAKREEELARIDYEQKKGIAELLVQIEIMSKSLEKEIAEKKGQLEVQKIESESLRLRELTRIDIEHNENMKLAEYRNKLETANHVAIEVAKSIANNSKIFYGDSLPKLFGLPGMFNSVNGSFFH